MVIVKTADFTKARQDALATYDRNVEAGDRLAFGRGEAGNVICHIKTVRGRRAGQWIARETYIVDGMRVARGYITTI